jgi:hypothetical protein
MVARLEYAAASVVLALFVVLMLRRLWRMAARRRGTTERPPDPNIVASLRWPRALTRGEMETYCAAFLRQQGWTVKLGRSTLDDATFITAERDASRIVVMCDLMGEELNPAVIRSFAQSGAEFGDARPVVVTRVAGRLPPPAEQAARAAGVRLLRVADLTRIDAPETAAAEAVAG